VGYAVKPSMRETHAYRSLLKMVEFRYVAQQTKPCQLFTPPRLWHGLFLRTGAHGMYEY